MWGATGTGRSWITAPASNTGSGQACWPRVGPLPGRPDTGACSRSVGPALQAWKGDLGHMEAERVEVVLGWNTHWLQRPASNIPGQAHGTAYVPDLLKHQNEPGAPGRSPPKDVSLLLSGRSAQSPGLQGCILALVLIHPKAIKSLPPASMRLLSSPGPAHPPTQLDCGPSDLCPREQRMVLRIVPIMGRGGSHTKCDSQWCPCLGATKQSTASFTTLPWGVTHQESGGITGKLCSSSRSSQPQQQRGPC